MRSRPCTAWTTIGASAVVSMLVQVPAAHAGRPEASCARLEVVAHRGTHPRGVDENTLAAFDRAAGSGHAVETDVWPDAEGRLWLMHDRDLTRTTGRHADIDSLSSAEVARLRYVGAGSAVLGLRAFVRWLGEHHRVRAYVEPKKRLLSVAGRGAVNVPRRIAAVLSQAGVADRSWITHFNDPGQAPGLRQRYPEVHLLHKVEGADPAPRTVRALGFDTVAIRAGHLTHDLVDAFHAVGVSVHARNSDRNRDWRRTIRSGADGLLTDHPSAFDATCADLITPDGP